MSHFPIQLQTIPASGSAEVPMNENFWALDGIAVFSIDAANTTGLTLGLLGGRWGGIAVPRATYTLADGATNYVVVNRSTGAVSVSQTAAQWNDGATYARLYKIPTASGGISYSAIEDHRIGPGGILAGEQGPPGGPGPVSWNAQTGNYTLALTDAENAVAINASAAATVTVPANSSVAFPVGTSILLYQEGAGQVSVAAAAGVAIRVRASYSLALAGQYALATVVKRATDEWILSGDLAAA